MGLRLWEGGAVYLNPEVDVGYGLANSVGAASYVDGAVAKVGRAAPYMRFQRYFLRQIIGLDGGDGARSRTKAREDEVLESTQNQISGRVDRDRIVVTLGKFAVGDVFDDNVYAHDPTTGFLNFAFNTMGAFDYAADSWGYTHGVAVEWKQNWWTARGGVFQLSTVPNGADIEPELFRQFMGVAEFEARYELLGQPGAIKFLAYGDNGYLSQIDDAIRYAFVTGEFPPDLDTVRKRGMSRPAAGSTSSSRSCRISAFSCAPACADGRYETVDYTDIDRSRRLRPRRRRRALGAGRRRDRRRGAPSAGCTAITCPLFRRLADRASISATARSPMAAKRTSRPITSWASARIWTPLSIIS